MMISCFVFLFGLCFGSFFACQADRMRDGWTWRAILMEPSRCLSCDTKLKWWNNVPLISFIVQRGRCAVCNARIPWHLPVIELLVAFGALVLYHLMLWVFNVA